MPSQMRDLLAAEFETDDRFHLVAAQEISTHRLPAVYLACAGRVIQGGSRHLRELIRVILVIAPMDTKEPWEDVNDNIDDALEIIYTVDNTFPELRDISTTTIKTQDKTAKDFAAIVIQVIGP